MVNRIIYASEVDASMDGFTFDNFTIKIDYADKLKHVQKSFEGSNKSYWDFACERFLRSINMEYDSFFNNSIITDECQNPDAYVAVFEYPDVHDDIYVEYARKCHHLVNCCRIFKASKIGFSEVFFFGKNGLLGGYSCYFPSAYVGGVNGDKFCLSESEKPEFAKFFEDINSNISYTAKELMGMDDAQSTSPLLKMFKIFHQSFSIRDVSIATLLRTIIFEMLIEGNTELTYRISRSIAVLLGKDIDQAVKIERKFKKLYNARSQYVHAGKCIDMEHAKFALETVCDLLKKLCSISDDMKTIQGKLHQGGFGSYPYP